MTDLTAFKNLMERFGLRVETHSYLPSDYDILTNEKWDNDYAGATFVFDEDGKFVRGYTQS